MSNGQKLLLADTDEKLARSTADNLTRERFKVKVITSTADTARHIRQFQPDLLILDPTLMQADGLQIIRNLRLDFRLPIIVTSGRSDVFSRVLALEMGADDYLTKPYDYRELSARVKALLRRTFLTEEECNTRCARCLEYPGLKINLDNYTVEYNGTVTQMPPKELELLFYLASSPNQVFTREQLLNHIWGYDYIGDSRTVDVHIKRLRKKLHDTGDWSLATVWGVGYKFELHSASADLRPSAQEL